MSSIAKRAADFCERFRMQVPILLAPMAGASAPSLSIAVARAGGLGACGALAMSPAEILAWACEVRAGTHGGFQLNLWVPDPAPVRDAEQEGAVRRFLAEWGPPVPADAGDATPLEFSGQCAAILQARPAVASSVMGLFPAEFVAQLRNAGIAWFATVTTVAEAKLAEAAGADAIVVQGLEAGGHRGSFDARTAESRQVGLFALLPAVVDAVRLPVIAAGGIADARGVAAALLLGACAVHIGTAFLRCPEARISPAWAKALSMTLPEDTTVSRVFSGRAGRSIATAYVRAATAPGAPSPAPYPVQRGLTAVMRQQAVKTDDVERMQAWAGQSAALAQAVPAGTVIRALWEGAVQLLGIPWSRPDVPS